MRHWLLFFIVCLVWVSQSTIACTDIRVIAKDNSVVVARSMEFAMDLDSKIMTSPRGREINSQLINQTGMRWKNKYAYLYVDGFHLGIPVDGLNERGLSFEALLFPGEAEYQQMLPGQEQQSINYLNIGDWILGNFETVEEVKQAIGSIYVVGTFLKDQNNLQFPLHVAVYDKSGKGIILEYVKGKLKIYDSIGIMTNSPAYDWHTTNLRNYLNLKPTNPAPIKAGNTTYAVIGQGSGMLGLPGDISSPSRFVKMSVMLNTVLQPQTSNEAVNLLEHMINNVDIPIGFARPSTDNNSITDEKTQWVVFKDLTHGLFYFRTYQDLNLHAIDMSQLNLKEGDPQISMSIVTQPRPIDMTNQLLSHGSGS